MEPKAKINHRLFNNSKQEVNRQRLVLLTPYTNFENELKVMKSCKGARYICFADPFDSFSIMPLLYF